MVEHLTPLRRRVDGPVETPELRHPDIAQWRPATEADIDDIVELEQAMGRVDHPNFLATREEVAEPFGLSHFDAEKDSLVARGYDGGLLASGIVVVPPGQETLVRAFLGGGVRPEARGRGIGRQLLDWQLARARQHFAASDKPLPGWIMVYTDERAPQNMRLYEDAGLSLSRYFLSLERVLAEPIRAFEPPQGVRVVPYSDELSEMVRLARNEAFQDHWGSQSTDAESWASFVDAEVFRPDLSFVVVADRPDTDRVVGFLLSTVNEADWVEQGFTGSHVALVGVVREWRGKHIAQTLLAAQLEAGRAAGYERVTLDVDSDSPTGALGLYTGMGYRPVYRELSFVREY
ncbi:GNAT family N-acetyltransferase [Luethyella okanaganae]|uniref:GNAT family N-acetyltransferase n=1 Tax=Luethyella okanaganae TaxID=69372 RepID=A0ABW1VIJ5_9MICO